MNEELTLKEVLYWKQYNELNLKLIKKPCKLSQRQISAITKRQSEILDNLATLRKLKGEIRVI